MSALKIIRQSLLVLTVLAMFHGLGTAQVATKTTTKARTATKVKPNKKRSHQAKLLKKNQHSTTTVQGAIEEIKNYLRHLNAKYKLKLSADEKHNLITTSSHMIYLKAGDEKPSTPLAVSEIYKIKRSLKGHLRMFHPEKFITPKTKTAKKGTLFELPQKLAKRTIRETTKDYLINTCGITDPQEVYTTWKTVKPLVNKKLDAASYRSDYDELLVPKETVGNVLQAVYQELTRRDILPQKTTTKRQISHPKKKQKKRPEVKIRQSPAPKTSKKKPSLSRVKKARRSQPSRRPYFSRKNIERSISLTKASKMIAEQVNRQLLSKTDRIYLQEQIAKKVKKTANVRGFVYPRQVQQIINEEVAQFKGLQQSLATFKKRSTRSEQHPRRHEVEAE